ncbi:MAG TPA: hypothetical protein VEL28_05910 [Candidatus Binatia bacterium]|nr:hypothetical protein [Candidatus Binatia bacterium]
MDYPASPPAPRDQSRAEADAKSAGCVSCHTASDAASMHRSEAVVLGCTDCHGGDASVFGPEGVTYDANASSAAAAPDPDAAAGTHPAVGAHPAESDHPVARSRAYPPGYLDALERAHVLPRYPKSWHWPSSAMPERTYTLLNREAPEFIRFVNPGDLRVAREACGACHEQVVGQVERGMMATMSMFWQAAAYNNGILPMKRTILGEAYTRDGKPAMVPGLPGDETPQAQARGNIEKLFPLPSWETIPPADNFRVFERGGRNIRSLFPEIGLPNPLEEPGRPDTRASNRGPGTGNRVSIPVLNMHKTRLNDPALWFMGTSDQPGDYRASGCSGCHVVYANDRDPVHSGPWATAGHRGQSATVDPTIARSEQGHPIRHELTRSIPTSQCMVCHMHQPNMFVNSYLGFTMWDYEADAPLMWPEKQHYPDDDELDRTYDRNPEGAAARGLWRDVEFLAGVSALNDRTKITQFADYHGHGWNFRAVFKRDRHGHLLDEKGKRVWDEDPDKFRKTVHMRDIHAERGMHCSDCHYATDAHGDGHIKGEVAAAVEIGCKDCHGTIDARATLRTSGPAAPPGGRNLADIRNPDGQLRFVWRGGQLYQRSLLWPEREWKVVQVRDTVMRGNADYNAEAARAKTMTRDRKRQGWGPIPARQDRAHDDADMACFTCHSSWVTTCGGCHLPIEANRKTERHHFEGGETRNFATYNPQVARDDAFILGRHGQVKDGIIAPVRSSSALVVSSTDINRNHIYVQQPPVASSGYSSQAFNPHFPHTVRTEETKRCDDCHLSAAGDNNAIMAQLLGLGTNYINLLGFHAFVGTEDSVDAVQVTEWNEPQAVLGSYLHRYAYPDDYARHLAGGRELKAREMAEAKYSHASEQAACVQLRGEYLYVAEGGRGMQAYDVANVANKNFSERIVTAPFSPLGHDARVKSRNATCVALPTTQLIRPDRNSGAPQLDELMLRTNLEQPMHPVYRYAAITDAEEGLILTDVVTLGDFEARNNFLSRDVVWNPGGLLNGAVHATFAGHVLYVAADAGIVVVDLDDPRQPRHLATIPVAGARASFVQFRYLFVAGAEGLSVVDVTLPERPRIVEGAVVALADARRVTVARTYAYVAAGNQGMAIIDVERPEQPRLRQYFDAGGTLRDVRDVAVAMTNGSLFAYLAAGRDGLAVVQLTSPDSQPRLYGFSPEPVPELIAWKRTASPALSVSRPLERDRAVDETGHQIAVFGRIGARPFTLEEMRAFFLDETGRPWTVE